MLKSPGDFSPVSSSPPPKPVPRAVIIDCISLFDNSLSILAFSELITFPRSGKIAWFFLSLPCFADPPAESPSTKYSSQKTGSLFEQSASFPGREEPPSALFLLISSRAFLAADRLLAANNAFSITFLPIDGFSSRKSNIPS